MFINIYFTYFCTLVVMCFHGFVDAKPQCGPDDVRYVYSECVNMNRWVFQVPSTGCELASDAGKPVKVQCDFSCNAGQYLDMKTNKCTKCSSGTYSLGDGLMFDYFDSLPDGFIIENYPDDMSDMNKVKSVCKDVGWLIRPTELVAIGSKCSSILSYTVELVKDGSVSFEYSYFDSSTVYFNFDVQSDRCSSSNNDTFLKPTNHGAERTRHRVDLKRGRNLLTWSIFPTAVSSSDDKHNNDVLASLRDIRIEGLGFVKQCSPCQAGYSSKIGSAFCEACSVNTHAKLAGSAKCTACASNEYSEKASAKCTVRPECLKQDYQQTLLGCKDGKSVTKYEWIPPKICVEKNVKLPGNEKGTSCNLCNKGQQLVGDKCHWCPAQQYSSDSSGHCQMCQSQVIKQYHVNNWYQIPTFISVKCTLLDSDLSDCLNSGWMLHGDYIRTSVTSDYDSYKTMTLTLKGGIEDVRSHVMDTTSKKHTSAAPVDLPSSVVYGNFTMDFEVVCSKGYSCKLFLLMKRGQKSIKLKDWTGSVARQKFNYELTSTKSVSFFWIFDQNENKDNKIVQDHVKIYSVSVTNAADAGGVLCQACPLGIKNSKCIPCSPGQYYDNKNSTCQSCPTNTYVANFPANSITDCHSCPPGLSSPTLVNCQLDMSPVVDTYQFNYRHFVTQNHVVKGSELFSVQGNRYYHIYNVSLVDSVTCASNTSNTATSSDHVTAHMCRLSLVPQSASPHNIMAALPISLGVKLTNATSSVNSTSGKVTVGNKMLKQLLESVKVGVQLFDRYLTYTSDTTTKRCPNGRSSVVVLRCDSDIEDDIQLPRKCADGTCDGCNFVFVWKSPHACPVCNSSVHFDRVPGNCQLGKQQVHLIPPKYCMKDGKPVKRENIQETCPLVAAPLAVILLTTSLVGLVSVILACHCHRKNKTLQYKYMQLVDSKGELPGVESCAVHEGDDDEEEDRVTITGGSSMFSKFTSSKHGRSEHLTLTEHMDDA